MYEKIVYNSCLNGECEMITIKFKDNKYIVKRIKYFTITWCDVNFIDVNECELPEDKIIEEREFVDYNDMLKYLEEELGIEDIY